MEITFIKSRKNERQYCMCCHKEVKLVKCNKEQWTRGSKAYGNSHVSACCGAKTYFAVKEER